jgi:hypothetical protein
MKKQFTPTPLCDINSVKYDVKRYNYPCDFTLNTSLCLNFTPYLDLSTLIIFSIIFQQQFNTIFSNILATI